MASLSRERARARNGSRRRSRCARPKRSFLLVELRKKRAVFFVYERGLRQQMQNGRRATHRRPLRLERTPKLAAAALGVQKLPIVASERRTNDKICLFWRPAFSALFVLSSDNFSVC